MSDDLIWRPQGKALSVHLSSAALSELSAELPRDLATGSGRVPECGGLLLGYARQSGEEWLVRVEQLVPMDIEHARGESWTLSGSDRKRLEQYVRRFAKPSESVALVGWYRTHSRSGLYLDQHDFNLFSDFFRHDASIGILASPRDRKGGIFFWEDGDIQRTAPYLTFDIPESRPGASLQPHPGNVHEVRRSRIPKWALAIPVVAGILLGIFWNPAPLRRGDASNTAQLPRLPEGQPSEDRPVFTPPPLPAPSTEPYSPPSEEEPVVARARTESPVRSPARTLVPPPQKRSLPEPQLTTDAPPLVAAATRSDARLSTAVHVPEVHTEVEPPKPTGVRKVVSAIPGLGFLKRHGNGEKDNYVPPRIVKKADPRLHRPVSEEVNLRFKLTINADGTVQRAELLTRKVDSEIANSAFDALKRWRFEPAERNNKPVAAELEVQFRIAPGAVAERRPAGDGGFD